MSDDDSIIGRTYGFGAEDDVAVIVEDQESVDSEPSDEPILNPYIA